MDDPLYMVGRNVLFAHWPIEPERLRPHVPDVLTIDTFDASAWLGIVAFRVTDAGFGSATRSLPVPLRHPFPQLNCRTYVRHGGEPGVYFFSLDTGPRIGATVGRRLLDLPCFGAKMDMTRPRPGRKVGFRSRRIGRFASELRGTLPTRWCELPGRSWLDRGVTHRALSVLSTPRRTAYLAPLAREFRHCNGPHG